MNKNNNKSSTENEGRMSFWDHLEELRWRLIKSIIAVLVASILGWVFADKFLYLLQHPVKLLPQIFTYTVPELHKIMPLEEIWVYLKLALVAGIFIGFPIIFYQMWAFVSPGLYEHEKKYVLPYCVIAWICFIVGAIFAYLIIMPAIITFLYGSTNSEIISTWSMKGFINLMLIMFVMFGFSFDLPIVFFLLMKLGIVTPESLARKRPYYIVVFFIIAAIVTPTVDPVTQSLMAGPMILLFEVSIILGRIMGIKEPKSNEEMNK